MWFKVIFKCLNESRYRYFEASLVVESLAESFYFYFYFDAFDLRSLVAVVSEVFAKASTFTSSENMRSTSPLLLTSEIVSVTILFSLTPVSPCFCVPSINCSLALSK